MQLRITTDYAIRCVLYLAQAPSGACAQEIGAAMGIPPDYARQLLRRLRIVGIVSAAAGGNGGYMLAKLPSEIRMSDIILPFEKTIRINRCLEPDGYCSRNGTASCPVHAFYSSLQEQLERSLDNMTVDGLLSENNRKAQRK